MMIEKGFYNKHYDNLKRSLGEHNKIMVFRNLRLREHGKIKREAIIDIQNNADYKDMFK